MLKRRRNQLPEDAFDQLSLVFEQNQGLPMLDLNAASALGKWLYKAGCLYFYQTFLHSLVRVDLTQVGRANSHRASLGKPLQQNVPGTCAIMASVICVEAQHRLQYESIHGSGTFICEAAQPTDAIGACYSQIVWRADINAYGRIWMPDRGADVGDALNKVMAIGGFATTTLTSGRNPGAPSRLQLVSGRGMSGTSLGKSSHRIV